MAIVIRESGAYTLKAPDAAATVIEFLTCRDLDDELAAAGIARFELD